MAISDEDVDFNAETREIRFTVKQHHKHTVVDLYNFIKNIDRQCAVCNRLRMNKEPGFVQDPNELRMVCVAVCSTYVSWTEKTRKPWVRC